jgi:hypothetical protein
MSIWRLVLCEIAYRKLNFGLSVLSVLVAVGCLVGEMLLLRKHELQASAILVAKYSETLEKMRALEDDYRKITKNLGFNVLILPRDQNLSDLYADDFASKYMPEEYAERLAKSRVATINHLLPSLQQKLKWPERERTILLIGVRGEVPIVHADEKKPILDAVPPGGMVLGYELHRSLKVAKGDKVKLLGREFTVTKLHAERGTKDDITVWINLGEAQELLGKKGRINAILALECNCSAERMGKIRSEIGGILPDTQVIELATQALARAEARNRAADESREAIWREQVHQGSLLRDQANYAAWFIPLVLFGCILWLGLLGFSNARQRSNEIGILRALGVSWVKVSTLLLSKAALVGIVGALLGYVAGSLFARFRGDAAVESPILFGNMLGLVALCAAGLVSALAAWVPALIVLRQDPADVLREE